MDALECANMVLGYAGDLLALPHPKLVLLVPILPSSCRSKHSVGRGLDPSSFYIPSIKPLIAHF